MSQHTQGPWKAEVRAGRVVVVVPSGRVMVDVGIPRSHVNMADARLIAKAPEMVELLKCYIGAHNTMTAKTLARYDAEAHALLQEIEGKG